MTRGMRSSGSCEAGCAQPEITARAIKGDVRSRSYTGKPCRMLRNDWTEAWEAADTPDPLGMPLQFMVTADAVSRVHRYASKAQDVAFNPVGQIVGSMNEVVPVRELITGMVEEYLEAVERLNSLMPE